MAVRAWSRYCAPGRVQRICCLFHTRRLMVWFTVDSTCAVATRSPGRRRLAGQRRAVGHQVPTKLHHQGAETTATRLRPTGCIALTRIGARPSIGAVRMKPYSLAAGIILYQFLEYQDFGRSYGQGCWRFRCRQHRCSGRSRESVRHPPASRRTHACEDAVAGCCVSPQNHRLAFSVGG